MKKIEVNTHDVKIISDAVSEYVNNLGDHEWIEGIFAMPCGIDKVESIVLGIVYNQWDMGNRIQNSNKNRLYMLAQGAGVELQVKDVSLDKCLDYLSYRDYDFPIKGILKSGTIIYDANGNLHTLQEEYKGDSSIASLEKRGAVEMEPAIQFIKK